VTRPEIERAHAWYTEHVRSLRRIATAAGAVVLEQTFPLLLCWWRNRKIRPRIEKEESSADLNGEAEEYLSLSTESLRDAHRIGLERLKRVQDRAHVNLVAVTVAVSLVFGTIGLTGSQVGGITIWSYLARFLIIVTVIWLSMAAFASIQVLAPCRVCDMWLQMRKVPFPQDSEEEQEKAKYIKMTLLNQYYTTMVTNYAEVSSIAMRNGVMAIAALLILTAFRGGQLW